MKPGELLDVITLSEKRRRILLLLREGPKTLSDLRDYFNVTSPEIIPQIRIMEQKRLLHQVGREYILTDIGELIASCFNRLVETLSIFEGNENFWDRHRIKGIPLEFQKRIHELGDYRIVRSDPTEVFEPHREYMQNLLKSTSIKGVSPIFHPEYPRAYLELAKKDIPIALIVTRDVFDRITREYRPMLEKGLQYKKVEFMICDEKPEVAFTVTNILINMGLFLKDGNYDVHNSIVSFDKSAIKWGEDLFKYYKERSEKVRGLS